MIACLNCGQKGLLVRGVGGPNEQVYDTRLADLLGIDPDPDPPKPNDGWRCFNCDEPYKENDDG